MGLLYRLSGIVFIGKSLEPLGGQNPLEPARLDCAVICGPYMTNFAEIMKHFEAQNGAVIAQNEYDLGEKIKDLFTDPKKRQAYSERAKNCCTKPRSCFGQYP